MRDDQTDKTPQIRGSADKFLTCTGSQIWPIGSERVHLGNELAECGQLVTRSETGNVTLVDGTGCACTCLFWGILLGDDRVTGEGLVS